MPFAIEGGKRRTKKRPSIAKGIFDEEKNRPSIETADFDEEKKRPSKVNLHVNSHRVKKRAPKNALQSQKAFLTRKKTPFNRKGHF